MKKILLIGIIVLLMFMAEVGNTASGNLYGYQVVETTGTTAIEFTYVVQEIYVVTMGTNTAYVNWTEVTTSTNNFSLGILGQTDVIDHTEEVNSSAMSVSQSTNPVHIRVQWKYRR